MPTYNLKIRLKIQNKTSQHRRLTVDLYASAERITDERPVIDGCLSAGKVYLASL